MKLTNCKNPTEDEKRNELRRTPRVFEELSYKQNEIEIKFKEHFWFHSIMLCFNGLNFSLCSYIYSSVYWALLVARRVSHIFGLHPFASKQIVEWRMPISMYIRNPPNRVATKCSLSCFWNIFRKLWLILSKMKRKQAMSKFAKIQCLQNFRENIFVPSCSGQSLALMKPSVE